MHYVLKMTNTREPNEQGVPNTIRIVGPFPSQDAAAKWASASRNNPNDNPLWQVVDLPEDPLSAVQVLSPYGASKTITKAA